MRQLAASFGEPSTKNMTEAASEPEPQSCSILLISSILLEHFSTYHRG